MFFFRELSFSRLECGVHDRLHIYPLCGVFYFPWHSHQIEGTNGFYCLIRKTERFTICNVESQVFTPNISRLPSRERVRVRLCACECRLWFSWIIISSKGLLPDSMSSMVIPIHNVHNHNLRNQNAYYIQHVRTNCRKCTIHYTGPILWNTLPQQLREAVSENQFKRKLKEFLLSSY